MYFVIGFLKHSQQLKQAHREGSEIVKSDGDKKVNCRFSLITERNIHEKTLVLKPFFSPFVSFFAVKLRKFSLVFAPSPSLKR